MNAYLALWKNYANFYDRTSRKGFWLAMLFHVIAIAATFVLMGMTSALSFLPPLYFLATLVPFFSILIRRLRDAGKHWIYLFFALLPMIGELLLIFFLCGPTKSDEGKQV